MNVYTPNVLGGVRFIYDTGAQYVYINYDTARLLFGPDFFDINRKRVVKMGSVDAYGAVNEEEYLFPHSGEVASRAPRHTCALDHPRLAHSRKGRFKFTRDQGDLAAPV